jgi:hypothetical protein
MGRNSINVTVNQLVPGSDPGGLTIFTGSYQCAMTTKWAVIGVQVALDQVSAYRVAERSGIDVVNACSRVQKTACRAKHAGNAKGRGFVTGSNQMFKSRMRGQNGFEVQVQAGPPARNHGPRQQRQSPERL